MNFFKLFCVLILLTFNNAIAQDKLASQSSDDINFTSDSLTVDEKSGVMTASGNVIIISEDRKIKADKVVYNKLKDEAFASGNVVLIDKDGIVQHQLVNNLPLGRNVEEAIRMLDALIHVETVGEVCPANWSKGKEAMNASDDGVSGYLANN